MARTKSSLVEEIIDIDQDKSLVPFIRAANALVTKCCSGFDDYTDEHLKLIETWLAAHMYTVFDPRTVTEQASSLQETYQSKVDLGLNTSHYGQTAMRLDWNGGLAALDNGIKEVTVLPTTAKVQTGITWLGTAKE